MVTALWRRPSSSIFWIRQRTHTLTPSSLTRYRRHFSVMSPRQITALSRSRRHRQSKVVVLILLLWIRRFIKRIESLISKLMIISCFFISLTKKLMTQWMTFRVSLKRSESGSRKQEILNNKKRRFIMLLR